MFKNMKIGMKLGLGFGVVMLLLLIVSTYNFLSFETIDHKTLVAQEACSNQAFAIAKEVDYLKWMASLADLFINEQVNEVTVQVDDHKCGLGKWLYSAETQSMAAADPELAGILERMKEPHARLHASAVEIGNEYIDFDTDIEIMLADRWADHLIWIKNVANSILTKTVFDGGVDPKQCAFGHWYYSYEYNNPEFRALMEKCELPHRQLHESAARLVEAQKSGNWANASDIYQTDLLTALSQLDVCYNEIDQWVMATSEQQQHALDIFDKNTRLAVAATQVCLNELTDYFANQSLAVTDQTNSTISSTISIMLALSMLAILIGSISAWLITRGITKPIMKVVVATEDMNGEFKEMKDAIQAIANNDLTVTIPESKFESNSSNSNDEIGTLVTSIKQSLEAKDNISASMRTMSSNLNSMIKELSDNARELVSAATEIASSSEEISRGSNQQLEQVNQISVAMEEMSATILESSKNSGEASQHASKSGAVAGDGAQIVSETIQGMQTIANVVQESAKSIGKLEISANKIGEIVEVIDDIADQTNLLALNAAIEAARAGEQGRGFAAVADEVRKLAERTGRATGEITEMITGIQSETKDAVHSMEKGVQEVDQGRILADKAGNSLNEIVSMSQRVSDMIQQIATATDEQSSTAEQISKNIESVSSVARESATGAEQSATAAEELNRNAEGLQQMVARFKVSS